TWRSNPPADFKSAASAVPPRARGGVYGAAERCGSFGRVGVANRRGGGLDGDDDRVLGGVVPGVRLLDRLGGEGLVGVGGSQEVVEGGAAEVHVLQAGQPGGGLPDRIGRVLGQRLLGRG